MQSTWGFAGWAEHSFFRLLNCAPRMKQESFVPPSENTPPGAIDASVQATGCPSGQQSAGLYSSRTQKA